MKRDMDLVRKILMACADYEHGYAPPFLEIDGYSEEQLGYHVYLMMQAGLVTAEDSSQPGNPSPSAGYSSLTWAGHEFLEASRNDHFWKKAKQATVATCGGGVIFDVLKSVLVDMVSSAVRKSVGLA